MDDFDCTTAGRAIAAYVDELSNWYVRLSRRRFWERRPRGVRHPAPLPGRDGEAARPVHPVPRRRDLLEPGRRDRRRVQERPDSVHLTDFPTPDDALRDPALEARVEAVRRAVELGRAARSQAQVKVRQPLARAVIVAQGDEREAIESMAELVRSELNVKRARVRLRGGGAGRLRGEAELPQPRPPLRQGHAQRGRGGRGARPGSRGRGDRAASAGSASTSTGASTRSSPRT